MGKIKIPMVSIRNKELEVKFDMNFNGIRGYTLRKNNTMILSIFNTFNKTIGTSRQESAAKDQLPVQFDKAS